MGCVKSTSGSRSVKSWDSWFQRIDGKRIATCSILQLLQLKFYQHPLLLPFQRLYIHTSMVNLLRLLGFVVYPK